MMEGKRYRWIWWVIAALLLTGLIGYTVSKNKAEEYTDGTLVWNPTDTLCMNNRSYCHLLTIYKPLIRTEEGTELCQKPYI